MPVITIAAPRHPDQPSLLTELADAVADVLALAPGDVIATAIETTDAVASGGEATAPWVVITLHGSDRGADARDATRSVADEVARAWAERHDVPLGGVWTAWITP